MNRLIAFALLLLALASGSARSDVAVPPSLLDPQTAPEAWNVIRLASNNVQRLITEKRLSEVPVQISLCSPALRALTRFPETDDALAQVQAASTRALGSVNALALAAQANNPEGAQSALDSLRTALQEIAPHFPPKSVAAEIFTCPMHADVLSDDPKAPCGKCGMDLLVRRIPYSFIYTKPGKPSIRLTAKPSGPVVAGKAIEVTVHLEKADHSPVGYSDLLLMHTEYIHLLIEEPGLGDYHHEHPKQTATPGAYVFSFTPRKSGPYRIWADIVPYATGLQELPYDDLPGGEAGLGTDTASSFTSTAGGYEFALLLAGGNHLPAKAGQTRRMNITITKADNSPVTTLEPVMNAFAHLVGFYEDYQTVLHLHPGGGEILNQELRGGPSLGFLLFPPKGGFVRLYCQVMIEGKMIFAPFNLNVEP